MNPSAIRAVLTEPGSADAMSRFAFTQVDVFTGTALRGNPLAVVHGATSSTTSACRRSRAGPT